MRRSRSSNFTRGLATGYFLLGINILYTALSVPLGLKYLGREQFGVWALAQQIAGYFLLLDLGMSAAVSRLIADKKAESSGADYRSLFFTGALVLMFQATAIVVLGWGFAVWAPALFSVPDSLAGSFTHTLWILAGMSGLSLAQRIFGLPLWAFQRMDVVNFSTAASLILALATIWIGLMAGWGIYSLAAAGLPGILTTAWISFTVCKRNRYYPAARDGLLFSWQHFNSCLGFGKDVFVVGLGTQLVNACQVMVVSRCLGLEAAATYSVATKFFYLAQQICSKIVQSSVSGLTEIFVQGLRPLFLKRILDLFSVVGVCAAWAACALILINGQMVRAWTSGKIDFPLWGDGLLGFLLIPAALSVVAIEAFIAMGFLSSIRYLRLLEGLLILFISLPASTHFGLNGVLGVSLTVGFFSLIISLSKLERSLPGITRPVQWMVGKILALLLALFIFQVFLMPWVEVGPAQHVVCVLLLGLCGLYLGFLVIPPALLQELLRFPKRFLAPQSLRS